jgi:hypothetical protein
MWRGFSAESVLLIKTGFGDSFDAPFVADGSEIGWGFSADPVLLLEEISAASIDAAFVAATTTAAGCSSPFSAGSAASVAHAAQL